MKKNAFKFLTYYLKSKEVNVCKWLLKNWKLCIFLQPFVVKKLILFITSQTSQTLTLTTKSQQQTFWLQLKLWLFWCQTTTFDTRWKGEELDLASTCPGAFTQRSCCILEVQTDGISIEACMTSLLWTGLRWIQSWRGHLALVPRTSLMMERDPLISSPSSS